MRTIIGLYSPAPRSGKGTAATEIHRQLVLGSGMKVRTFKFADCLKKMLAVFVGYQRPDLSSDEVWEHLEGPKRTEPLVCGRSARDLMIALGTHFGRERVSQSVWVSGVDAQVKASNADVLVFDDLRFPAEYDYLAGLEGDGTAVILIRLVRGDSPEQGTACEGLLEGKTFDYHIEADGPNEVRRQIVNILAREFA